MENKVQSYDLTPEQIETLVQVNIIPKGTPQAVIKVFSQLCKIHNLNPAKKEIFLLAYNKNEGTIQKPNWVKQYAPIVGRDGLRIKAQRTGQFAGIDDPKFDIDSKGNYKTISMYKDKEFPVSCTITIYRLINGLKCSFTASVSFAEFNGGKQKWVTMPFHMITKVAECHALKAGFGEELQGLHVEEEMAAFEDLSQGKKEAELTDGEIKDYIFMLPDTEQLGLYFNQLQEAKLLTPEIRTLFIDRKKELHGKQLTA